MKRRAKQQLEPKTAELEIVSVDPSDAEKFEEHFEWVDRQLALLILGPELAAELDLSIH